MRLWSLKVQLGYYTKDNELVDRLVERLEELSLSVQHSEPAGIVLGKRWMAWLWRGFFEIICCFSKAVIRQTVVVVAAPRKSAAFKA